MQSGTPNPNGSRDELTDIDRAMGELLARRLERSRRAAERVEAPAEDALQFTRPPNELVLLAERFDLPPVILENWWRHTVSICRRVALPGERVAALGPVFSYSHLAAIKHFGMGVDLAPVATIEAAFEEVVRGHASLAVVPVENSTDGRVVDTLSTFARFPVTVCGEILLPIHHCLLGKCRRAEITEVRSKPQALSQCRGWLASHLPTARVVEVASTAAAAADAARLPGVAAIASREAGIQHGLDIINENIEDNPRNITRFVIIGNRQPQPTGRDKTLIILRLAHRPGALADAMNVFRDAAINMTWIESFPLTDAPSEYLFFIEFEGHRDEAAVSAALEELRQHAQRLDVLGSYPQGELE